MSTFTEFIQTPQAYTLETVISKNPEFMDTCIQYLTVPQDPLLCNERECYLYASKVADLLSIGMSYRLLVKKRQMEGDKVEYPFLQKLFTQIQNQNAEPTLLGYCSRVLIALVKKTPEIYQFVKDKQQLMVSILKDDHKLECLREFISLLLVESTMQLYVFLKTMVIRTLIFRIVEEEEVGEGLFKCFAFFYKEMVKALADAGEEEKAQLQEVSKLFEEEHFITLLILKLDSSRPTRNVHITELLSMVTLRSHQASEIITLHIDSILDYLEQYEETQAFLGQIGREHISLLTLLIGLAKMNKLSQQLLGQLIKRLLVYSNVHSRNTLIHNLLFDVISSVKQKQNGKLLNQLNIVEFFIKNTLEEHYGFMALRRRIFHFWIQHGLDSYLEEEDKETIRKEYSQNRLKIQKSKYYKQSIVDQTTLDLGTTKITAELSVITSTSVPQS